MLFSLIGMTQLTDTMLFPSGKFTDSLIVDTMGFLSDKIMYIVVLVGKLYN